MNGRRILGLSLAAGIVAVIAWGPGRDNQPKPEPARSEPVVAQTQSIDPAPTGDPAVVAQTAIRANFDKAVCPLVTEADRFGDGSIRATCNNGETFRVFSVSGIGVVALRCSVAGQLGIEGC